MEEITPKVETEYEDQAQHLLQQSAKSSPKKVRHSKKHRGKERNYKCSCGLTYLSYPALYTHIKIKHQGKAPGIIQMPRTQKVLRLKRYQFAQQGDQNAFSDEQYFCSILQFLNAFGHRRLNFTIAQIFVTFQSQEAAPLVDAVTECDDQKHNYPVFESGIYNISIDHAFARFLLKLHKKIDSKIYQQIIILFLIWRNTINRLYTNFEIDVYNCYSRDANCMNVLQVVNDIVMTEFSDQCYRFKKILEQAILFQPAKRLFNLMKFIYLFSRWLFASRYTNLKLQFNKTVQH